MELLTVLTLWLAFPLATAPDVRLDDLSAFPPRDDVRAIRLAALGHRNWTCRYTPVYLSLQDRDDWLHYRLAAQWHYEVWDTLYDAQHPYMHPDSRLYYLRLLRGRLGWEAFAHGAMPPPVPVPGREGWPTSAERVPLP